MSIINTHTGPVKICSLWDFISDVKREYIPTRFENRSFFVPTMYAFDSIAHYTTTQYELISNPHKAITSLRKGLKTVSPETKETLGYVLEDLCSMSAMEGGQPTHFFPIGKDKYALVCKSDITLFTDQVFMSQFVCTAKSRNFLVKMRNE